MSEIQIFCVFRQGLAQTFIDTFWSQPSSENPAYHGPPYLTVIPLH